MPNRNRTGLQGRGSATGRGMRNRPLGSNKCTCPKCGHEESHQRGIPCSKQKCPKCQTPMRGVNCL
jgi:hypothetical protein